jgi:hypothetical protein
MNANEAMVGSGASMESGGLFCVAAFGSRREDLTFNLLHEEML